MLETNRDIVFLMLIIVWFIVNTTTWILFGPPMITVSNLGMIILFGVLILLARQNSSLKKWLNKKR